MLERIVVAYGSVALLVSLVVAWRCGLVNRPFWRDVLPIFVNALLWPWFFVSIASVLWHKR